MDEFNDEKYFDLKEKILNAIKASVCYLNDGSQEYREALQNALEDYWD